MNCEVKGDLFKQWHPDAEGQCPVDYCKEVMATAKSASCGKDVLCREGTWQVYEIMKEISEGKAESEDYELMMDLLMQIKAGVSCDMAKTASTICLDLLKTYEDEWDKHIKRKLCSSLVCKGAFTVHIDPSLCDGCGKCVSVCSSNAIVGGEGMIHIINNSSCSKSLVCIGACPKGAVVKAGARKPKTPDTPVPVGSFGQSAGGEGEGGKRKRRRKG